MSDEPRCKCGNPIKFANQSKCEDCWNEPEVIGTRADGKPLTCSMLSGSCISHYRRYPRFNENAHRPMAQQLKILQLDGIRQEH